MCSHGLTLACLASAVQAVALWPADPLPCRDDIAKAAQKYFNQMLGPFWHRFSLPHGHF